MNTVAPRLIGMSSKQPGSSLRIDRWNISPWLPQGAPQSPKATPFISLGRESQVKTGAERVAERRHPPDISTDPPVTAGTDISPKPDYSIRNMPQTYAANFIHCIFSTKDRRDTIPQELQEKLWAYLLGIAKNLGIELLAAGGTANHVHLLISLPPKLPLAEAVQKLKANSSRWFGEHDLAFERQRGYGAFSVSPSQLIAVQIYIRNQAEHHKKRNFEEEFLALLRKSGVVFDAEHLFAA
jgi:putative transposase